MYKTAKHYWRGIRSKVFMHHVFLLAPFTEKTAENFARYFEPEGFRTDDYGNETLFSAKWERSITGFTLPRRNSTAEKMIQRHPQTAGTYDSLLWDAIKPGSHSDRYWLKFFQKLSPAFKRITKQGQFSTLRNQKVKFTNGRKIKAIYRYFNIDEYSHEDDRSFSPKLITRSHPC